MLTQERSRTFLAVRLLALMLAASAGLILWNGTTIGASNLNVTPTTVEFPHTGAGSYSYESVTITNNGTATETLNGWTTPSTKFWATSGTCDPGGFVDIPPNASCKLEFGYAPANAGADHGPGTITFKSGAVLDLMFAVAPAKGDVDCDGDVTAVDALKDLRFVAALDVSQTQPCTPIGGAVQALAAHPAASIMGDMDCDADVSPVDALHILRFVAGLPNNLPEGCPAIGG